MKIDTTSLGAEIRTIRTLNSLTQEELAKASGINIRTIQRAEKGTPVGMYALRRMLVALNQDVLEMLRRFRGKEATEEQQAAATEPVGFNPDRWLAAFRLKRAHHDLWGQNLRNKAEQIKMLRGQVADNAQFEDLEARSEELELEREAYALQAEELDLEGQEIDQFDWPAWELQKEMEIWARHTDAEERAIEEELKELEVVEEMVAIGGNEDSPGR